MLGMKRFFGLLFIWMIGSYVSFSQDELYRVEDGEAKFTSNAPLEIIKAESKRLQGVLNSKSGEFAFRIPIKSFDGFNSPLQKEHFFENYMEAESYPTATFQGKIIESIDNTTQSIRAKGNFTIHGLSNEMIIPVTINSLENGTLSFQSTFFIKLKDHNIQVPKIVYQKIAQEILVEVKGELKP